MPLHSLISLLTAPSHTLVLYSWITVSVQKKNLRKQTKKPNLYSAASLNDSSVLSDNSWEESDQIKGISGAFDLLWLGLLMIIIWMSSVCIDLNSHSVLHITG